MNTEEAVIKGIIANPLCYVVMNKKVLNEHQIFKIAEKHFDNKDLFYQYVARLCANRMPFYSLCNVPQQYMDLLDKETFVREFQLEISLMNVADDDMAYKILRMVFKMHPNKEAYKIQHG